MIESMGLMMEPSDKTELSVDPEHSRTGARADSVRPFGAEILTPLASRSLFWRARYLEESPVLRHIPLLFWISEAVRPEIAVTLGLQDAVPHFALCQAVDKLDLESWCVGVDQQPASAETVAFNQRNYEDFSSFVEASVAAADILPYGRKADLVVVNMPLSRELIAALSETWLPQLSDRGILLFLHGPEADATEAFDAHFMRNGASSMLWQHDGASVMLCGSTYPERLQRLVHLRPGHPGYVAANTVFRRLGELHDTTFKLERSEPELKNVRQINARNSAELQKAQAKLNQLSDQQDTRDIEAEKTQRQNKLLREELSGAQKRVPALESEVSDLRKQNLEQEQALEERFADIAILGQKIVGLKERLEAAEQERNYFAERVHALEHSTSWKVTGPLRALSRAFRRS